MPLNNARFTYSIFAYTYMLYETQLLFFEIGDTIFKMDVYIILQNF